ncbi:MAG: alanine racemase [Pseudomonadales bacterium]|nr:alanine racemase [Pseudomonadales bacterium]
MGNSPQVCIHLNNIRHNFNVATQLAPGVKIMAVVKANAYGHGAVQICNNLVDATGFAVARVTEGISLRCAGIGKPIYVFEGFLDESEMRACRKNKLIPFVHASYQLDMLDSELPVWIKVNTGMNRLGFTPEQITLLQETIRQKNIVGVASHFANADCESNPKNKSQVQQFHQAVDTLALNVELSLANSDCIFTMSQNHLDWIRPGIMLYGSSTNTQTDNRLKHCMTLSAPTIAINVLKKGDAIGYGGDWRATKDCRVAVVGIGYADGYPREMPEGTPILVKGMRRRLVGRISMDMLFVELEWDDELSPGEHVTLWGEDLSIDEIAACANSIAYTLMTGLTERVERFYTLDSTLDNILGSDIG